MKILRLCDGVRTLQQIASGTPTTEEQAFRICEYFNKKAVLEKEPSNGGGYFPSVTVIIPTKDRRDELLECIDSIFSQDYPKHKVELIVIDDGSHDGTRDLVNMFRASFSRT